MTAHKMDRRVRRTRMQLRSGLIQLLQKKSIKDITVRELTDLLDINRSTFYLHCRDIHDLLDQIVAELLEELNHILDEYHPTASGQSLRPLFTRLFRFVEENRDICRILLSPQGDMAFLQNLKNVLRERSLRHMGALYPNSRMLDFELYISFTISGVLGVVQNWLGNSLTASPEEMAELVDKIMCHGVGMLTAAEEQGEPKNT